MLKNKYIKLAIRIYSLLAIFLFVWAAKLGISDGVKFQFRDAAYFTILGMICNLSLFLVVSNWASRNRKTTMMLFLPTILLVPNWFMVNRGIGSELHLIFSLIVFVLFIRENKN